jgi:2-pyrone-4,6-dicarboxylate lactonase
MVETWMAKLRKPKLTLPAGACDTHVHVFGPGARFPHAGARSPGDAPKEALFALHEAFGIRLGVIVHTAAHGHDLRATEDALAGNPRRFYRFS